MDLHSLGISADSLKALGATSGSGGAVTYAMTLFEKPVFARFFHRQRFFVKPAMLASVAVASTAVGGVGMGMSPAAAAVSGIIGLAGAVIGPGWKHVWAEAEKELEEELSAPSAVAPGPDAPKEAP
jgi:hypothetical protein